MIRIVAYFLFFFSCFARIQSAQAYDFAKIQSFFSALQNEYGTQQPLSEISLRSLKRLSEFDDNLILYNNDTKAFLYNKNNLVGVFELPQSSDMMQQWEEFIVSVLQTSSRRFDALDGKEADMETLVLKSIVSGFDSFSRVDKLPQAQITARYDAVHNIIYIKPSLFYIGLAQAISDTVAAHPQTAGMILDLRGCSGGNFNEALKTADLFLDTALIAYSQNNKKQLKYYTATPGDILHNKPIAILTDNTTASAAELIAAALSEQSRAVLVGTQTFGKGSIQNTYNVKDQTLFLTSGHFFTPSGKSLDQAGITPQICTGLHNSCTTPDRDNFSKDVKIAIELIKNKIG